jgi:hypothetical protein
MSEYFKAIKQRPDVVALVEGRHDDGWLNSTILVDCSTHM